MKRVLILGCLIVLFLVGVISTTVFAVLYINSQNDLKTKTAELAACSVKTDVKCPELTTTTTSSELTFSDEGQSILVKYPSSWTGILNTKISTDFAYEPEYGKVISGYEFNLTKSGATLKFKSILAGIDGFPFGLKASDNDWKEISGTTLVRYSAKGANDWKYVQKTDCSSLALMDPSVDVSSFSFCVGSFFPGFGTKNASVVTIKTSDSTLLEEADQIAKSALN